MSDQTLDGIPDLVSIGQAATATRLSPVTIRKAIKRGELAAFTVGGRDPLRSGRGLGYRIRRADLQAWYFGQNTVVPT